MHLRFNAFNFEPSALSLLLTHQRLNAYNIFHACDDFPKVCFPAWTDKVGQNDSSEKDR